MVSRSVYIFLLLLLCYSTQDLAQSGTQQTAEARLGVDSTERLDYLIVTTETLKQEFEALIEWKIRKGLKAEILTLNEIFNSYQEPTSQLRIKRCLEDLYQNRQLKWVLLGGDENTVPVQRCYTQVSTSTYLLTDSGVPTDLFYACFDKRFDWNSNLDDRIGQIHRDGHDIYPDIWISRIPVSTPTGVRNYVFKTLAYEQDPPREDFGGKMLFAGIQSNISWEGKSDNHHRSELLFSEAVEPRWQGQMFGLFDTGTDFPGGANYHVTSAHLIEQLERGAGIVHYAGPGIRQALVMENGPPFTTFEALGLAGAKSGIMLSTTTELSAYDSVTTSLSETLLLNPNGGSVAFFGNTRLGFGYTDTSMLLGPSYQYSAAFFKYLFSGGSAWKTFGELASDAKTDFALNGGSGGAFHYLLYSINAMGDPELPILTGDPAEFNDVRIYSLGNTINVNTGGIRDCRICLTSLDLGEGYQQVTEGTSFYTFEDIPADYQLTITAPNHVPYIYQSGFPTGESFIKTNSVNVYPNPCHHILFVEAEYLPVRIRLIDLHGRVLLEKLVNSASGQLDLEPFKKGIYIVETEQDEKVKRFRILKL